jgi:hexokinase
MNVLPNTEFDQMVDDSSINPGEQMFEKRVSGMFLGEIMRRVVLHLIRTANLFDGKSSDILDKHNSVDSAPLSKIAADKSPELSSVAFVIRHKFGIPTSSLEDRKAVKIVSDAIVRRSARLAAVPVSAVCDYSGRYATSTPEKPVDVGADGSLVEHYPRYIAMCLEACDEILGGGAKRRIHIELAKDGSGVGAAL